MHTAAASAEIEASLKASAPGPVSPVQPVINYCPNKLRSAGTKQIVKLTFAQWQYRATHEVTVEGSFFGSEVVKEALEILHEDLPVSDWGKELLMVAPAEDGDGNDQLFVSDDEYLGGHDWLEKLLIASEITQVVFPSKP